MLLLWGSKPVFPTPVVSSGPTFTDNGDGTGSFALTTDISTYAGVDYGSSAATYTYSAFDYSGAGPALELNTTHAIPIPDALAGGTQFGSWYYRVWLGTPAGFSGYVGAESTFAIAPVLSSASAGTPTTTGTTGAAITTNCGSGTLYYGLVTNGGSCTNAQLIAGTGGNLVAGTTGNQAVSATGAQSFNISGAAGSTTYQIKTLHVVQGAQSNQGSVSLTTSASSFSFSIANSNNWKTAGNFSGDTLTLAFTNNVSAGSLLVVLAVNGANQANTITDSQGNTYSAAKTQFGAAIGTAGIYWAIAGSSGACTVTQTSVATQHEMFIAEYAATGGTIALDGTAQGQYVTSTTNPTPGTATGSASTGLVVGGVWNASVLPTAGTNYTRRQTNTGLNNDAVEDWFSALSGSSFTPNWSAAASTWISIGAAWKAT